MEQSFNATSHFWSKHPEVFENPKLLRNLTSYDQELAYKFKNLSTHEKIKIETWIDNHINEIELTEIQRKIAIQGLHGKLVNRVILHVIRIAMKHLGFIS